MLNQKDNATIDIPSTPQKAQEKTLPDTPSTMPGTPSIAGSALEKRAAELREVAEKASQPSIKAVWPGDCPPSISANTMLDEKLWEDILVKFGASAVPAARDAQHFEDVIKFGLDPNSVPFPQKQLRNPNVPVAHMASEPDEAVPYQDAITFPFLQELGKQWSNDVEKESFDSLLAGRAKEADELRKAFYSEEPLDMEPVVPWPCLQDAVMVADECTEAQVTVWELRAKRPLSPERLEKRLAKLSKKLKGELNRTIFEEVQPTLEQEAARLELAAARARDAATEARQFDELAENGAAFVVWPVPNERRWPAQSSAWKQHAKWFKMWRARPMVASSFAFEPLKRNSSTSSLSSWAVLSDVSWEDMESKASECGWQQVLDEQEPALAAIEPTKCLAKEDIVEIKSMSSPPPGAKLTMEVICIMLQVPPVKVKSGGVDYWDSAKQLLGQANFLHQVSTLRDFVPAKVLDAVAPYMSREDFTPESVQKASKACAGLCRWAREVYKYHVLGHASSEALRQEFARKPAADLIADSEGALGNVSLRDLQEVKALCKPPASVGQVGLCLVHLFTGIAPKIEPTKKGTNVKDLTWRRFQKLCGNPTLLLQQLKDFKDAIDAGRVPRKNIRKARKIQIDMGNSFSAEVMKSKSSAVANLCTWISCMLAYYDLAAPQMPEPAVSREVAEPDSASGKVGPAAKLSKSDIVELKALKNPAAGVRLTLEVICVLLQVPPKVSESGVTDYWAASKELLGDMNFLNKLLTLSEQVPKSALDAAAPYMSREDFTPESVKKASVACEHLCAFAHEVYQHHARQSLA